MMEDRFYTVDETAKMLGKNRATLYSKMQIIGLRGHKFKGDRKTYLSQEEVNRLKTVFEKPWTAPEKQDAHLATT